MNILAIETTGASASVAVIDEQGQIFEVRSSETLNHLQVLMPMVGEILEKSKLQINNLTAIAASQGPGSFTGIRIGVSTARALAQALELPCIGVPTLETFLYNGERQKGIYCPIFNARRGQVYGGAYRWREDGTPVEVVKGSACLLAQLLENLQEVLGAQSAEITFFGDGVEAYAAQIEQWQNSSLNSNIRVKFAEPGIRYQNASSVAKLALELYKKGEVCSPQALTPNYMRKAEAERKLEEAEAERKRQEAQNLPVNVQMESGE
ncbi:tRNA (adenosine(37)-N6)-threonylcarbamoyltransferase complex dimerization subunit type 1 TsaB [Aminipila butyrica]|uniref:tRNA (Adenosine(37)-N6)-threonylcarbamoyltransferase complex dimerization subunit type 1 TsaB n=1 Tax=Aminipila butyrica TaxID=433296 RepID=A0A858BXU7_9FIRM|nr:tRNA (adenosine(37)-N6)-threonylcarbamoyltransferase complex dimerization subunit type 1 TsaB [Aminipila butyrica]QIB70407.1 tRNA (adenosine(37)-N6)-threonylcarbamoyltransferase complex dimerization subunit type 1 TsaB [Aminipila butyrica]